MFIPYIIILYRSCFWLFDYTLMDGNQNNADKLATEYQWPLCTRKMINEIKEIIKKAIFIHLVIYDILTSKIVASKCSQYRLRYCVHDII